MGDVLALAAIGAVALVGAVFAGVTWRRGVDERQSVKEYHSTLETLRHVSDRIEPPRPASARSGRKAAAVEGAVPSGTSGTSGTRFAPAKARAGAVAPESVVAGLARSRASVPEVGTPSAGAPRRRAGRTGVDGAAASSGSDAGTNGSESPALVFDDAAPLGESTPDARSRRAVERMRGPRRGSAGGRRSGALVAAAAGVVVVAGLVAGAVVALTPTHTTHGGQRASRSSGSGHSAPTTTAHTTPTTVPPTVQPTAATPASATYTSPAGAYTVVLSASDLCWIMATDPDTGQVLWTGTMQAGQTQSLAGTGPMRVKIGAASVITMTLQGQPVALPSPFQSPFTATFTPAG